MKAVPIKRSQSRLLACGNDGRGRSGISNLPEALGEQTDGSVGIKDKDKDKDIGYQPPYICLHTGETEARCARVEEVMHRAWQWGSANAPTNHVEICRGCRRCNQGVSTIPPSGYYGRLTASHTQNGAV